MHESGQLPSHHAEPGPEAHGGLPGAELSPGTDVGGYKVEVRLGAGGFGTVFRARRGGRLYALKLLPLEEVGEWGVREMLTLARVQHPNVVRLLGHGQWPDQAPRYFVVIMEYVPGRRLDVWASTENPSAREVVRKVLSVTRALEALHRVKVVHRDVKEANLLVRDDTGEVVVVDLGVGSDAEASWRTGGLLPPGTPDYRSPEAWRFEREHKDTPGAHYRPTASDDLYALGVVLYWLLTNHKPFYLEGRRGVEAILTQAPTPPHVLNPRVPVELSELCLRLLAKRPEERPEDARVLGLALTELLERQEARWEQPLCEAFNEHTATTRPGPGADELAAWGKQAREAQARPRRGRRPLAEEGEPHAPVAAAAPALPAQGPEAAAGSSPPVPNVLARARRVSRRVAVGLILAVAVGGGVAWLWGASPRLASPSPRSAEATGAPREAAFEHTWEVGWKVAPPWKPPEATRRDLLVTEEVAPVAPATSSEKGEASVKNPQQQKQKKGLGSVGKAITTGSACLTLACTGPQVRPEPPAEPCPPGAIQAMDELDIDIGDKNDVVLLSGTPGEVTSVREGETRVRLLGAFEDLPPNTLLKGRLLFGGERIYGRFTEAQEYEGPRTWPVCMELLNSSSERGLELEPGSTAETAKVFNAPRVRAVDHFK